MKIEKTISINQTIIDPVVYRKVCCEPQFVMAKEEIVRLDLVCTVCNYTDEAMEVPFEIPKKKRIIHIKDYHEIDDEGQEINIDNKLTDFFNQSTISVKTFIENEIENADNSGYF